MYVGRERDLDARTSPSIPRQAIRRKFERDLANREEMERQGIADAARGRYAVMEKPRGLAHSEAVECTMTQLREAKRNPGLYDQELR